MFLTAPIEIRDVGSASIRIVHIHLSFEKLLPSVVVTACCPYNQIRKRRRTRVICMQSVFSVVSWGSNRESWCRVGVSGVTNESIVFVVRKLELVPSIIFTTCCPYNQVRKGRRTRVICMQSVFCIVSRSSDRENRCRVGATIVVVVVGTTSRRVRILVTWCNFAPIAYICVVFVLEFSSWYQKGTHSTNRSKSSSQTSSAIPKPRRQVLRQGILIDDDNCGYRIERYTINS